MLAIEVVKECAGRGAYHVKSPGARFLETINWRDVRLEDDQYVMQCFPVSSLPNDPAGRLQTVQEYVQAGFYSQRQAKRLLAFPDLEQEDSLAQASEDYLYGILDRVVENGEPTVIEPLDNLALALELTLEYYHRGKEQNLEEERLEMLRRMIAQVNALQAASLPPPAPMPALPGPLANPMAPPVSDLVPNVNSPGVVS
jgi:hypothetical protein